MILYESLGSSPSSETQFKKLGLLLSEWASKPPLNITPSPAGREHCILPPFPAIRHGPVTGRHPCAHDPPKKREKEDMKLCLLNADVPRSLRFLQHRRV